jgi:hypothetical protein
MDLFHLVKTASPDIETRAHQLTSEILEANQKARFSEQEEIFRGLIWPRPE